MRMRAHGGRIAWAFEIDRQDFLDAAGPSRHYRNAIAEHDGFIDRVGNEEHGSALAIV